MNWTQQQAVNLCIVVEAVCPPFGCHVALTGGTLYRPTEPRKDCDILFYRIRQVKKVDVDGLFKALEVVGLKKVSGFGWCHKAEYEGKQVDCFFPEEQDGHTPDGSSGGQPEPVIAPLEPELPEVNF